VAALLSRPGARALDLGCGVGWSSIALAAAYPALEVLGIDMSSGQGDWPEGAAFVSFGTLTHGFGAAEMPLTVFVTAYDQHAIRAFERNALDYLLKPFSDERFEATMARVKSRLDERSLLEFGQRVMKMVSAAPAAAERRLDRLVVKSGGTTRFIRVVDIDWIEAAGVYVTLHVAGKELLYRAALNDLAEKLDPRRFVRVHRSALVNIESILQLEPISHGEFEAVLKNGARTRVSRTYRVQLEKRLGQPL